MGMKNQPSNKKLLNLPVELRDEASVILARRVIMVGLTMVGGLLIWGSVASIEEIAVAPGKVVPAEHIGEVHHFEGGIVEQIHVKEGTRVGKGEVLVSLRPEQAAGDLSQLQARAANLAMKKLRLSAAITGMALDFGMYGNDYPQLRQEHKIAFQREQAQAHETGQQLMLTAQRYRDQLLSAQAEMDSLEVQISILSEQAKIRERSHRSGYTSKHTMLQSRASLEQAKQKKLAASGRVGELTKLLEEAETKQRESAAARLSQLSEESAETAAQLAETEEAIAKHRDRVERLAVVSPMAGVVQTLSYKHGGEVIKPGAVVAQIVPNDDQIVAEVELRPRDIGHVRIGNKAEIKLSNYDPNIVGVINGEVQLISATTFETREGNPYYKVRIAMERDALHAGGRDYPITAGTTLNAQILTGSKTVLRYMLKPVFQSFDTAFAER